MEEKFTYEIGGKKYTQKKLVLGQINQLVQCLPGVVLPSNPGALGIISAFGGKLPKALAIVLIPEGVPLRDKDIDALAAELEFSTDTDAAIRVIEDFFDCNPLSSLSERLTTMSKKIVALVEKGGLSKASASSSREETSPKETPSSGDTRQRSAKSGQDTDQGKSSSERPCSLSSE